MPGTQLEFGGQAGGNSKPGIWAWTAVLSSKVPRKKRRVLESNCFM